MVSEATGLHETQIKRYEGGEPFVKIPDRMWILSTYYRWTPDSLERVLAGGEPELAPGPPRPQPLAPGVLDKVIEVVTNADGFSGAEKREFLRWLLSHET